MVTLLEGSDVMGAERYLGPVAHVPMGEGRVFLVDGTRVVVFRQRNGRLYAVQAECPHTGGPLAEGILGSGTLICPLHGWKFNLASGECLNEPRECLKTYAVREDRGWIVLSEN